MQVLFFLLRIFYNFFYGINLKGVLKMDEMKIKSKFTTMIVSKILKGVIKSKTGYDVNIQLNELQTSINDGKTHIHLDVDAEINKEELMKLLNTLNLQ